MLKLINPEIDVGAMSRLLRVWKQRKISSSQQTRLLRLWLGVEFKALMDAEGRYPENNLLELARLLSYRNTRLLLDDIRKTDSFILLRDGEEEVTHVCSPLWAKCVRTVGKVAATLPENRNSVEDNNININHPDGNNIINYIFKEKEEEKESSTGSPTDLTGSPGMKKSRKRNLEEVTEENMQTVRDFFHYLKINPALRHEFMTSYIEEFRAKGYTREWATKMLVAMMQDTFMPYLARKQEFLNESDEARVTRFRGILESKASTWVRHAKGAAEEKIKQLINEEKLQNNGNINKGKLWR